MTLNELRDTLISAFSANYKINVGQFISDIRNNITNIYDVIDYYKREIIHKYFTISIRSIENDIYDSEYYILHNKRILARFINNADHYNVIFSIIPDNITFNYSVISDNPSILISGCDYSIMMNEDNSIQILS